MNRGMMTQWLDSQDLGQGDAAPPAKTNKGSSLPLTHSNDLMSQGQT